MSNRRALCLSVALLLLGFGVPAFFAAAGITFGTLHQGLGLPVFAHVKLSWAGSEEHPYREFESLEVKPAMYWFYLLVPLAGGFLAGRVWPRRPRTADRTHGTE